MIVAAAVVFVLGCAIGGIAQQKRNAWVLAGIIALVTVGVALSAYDERGLAVITALGASLVLVLGVGVGGAARRGR